LWGKKLRGGVLNDRGEMFDSKNIKVKKEKSKIAPLGEEKYRNLEFRRRSTKEKLKRGEKTGISRVVRGEKL